MQTKKNWDNVYREITPLTGNDCYLIFTREKNKFTFPLHVHEEFELNFIERGSGVQRIVGDHIGEIDDLELVLVGSNLPHGWFTHNCKSDVISEITLQFHKSLIGAELIQRNQLSKIRTLFKYASQGILFSKETAILAKTKLLKLTHLQGFESVLELLSLLHDLSSAENTKLLSSPGFNTNKFNKRNKRIEEVFDYIHKNLKREITLTEIAALTNLSKEGFSRFFRKHTGKTFIETLNDIRLGLASRALIETDDSITQIAYECGFNNLSYFNRLFKRKYKSTPKVFRKNYMGKRFYV